MCALGLAGCSPGAQAQSADTRADTARRPASAVTHKTAPKALERLSGARINIADGRTVGVGMPVSVTFDHPVAAAERARTERQLTVTVRAGAGITRHFTVGRSLVATVDVRTHTMKVVKDGATRTVPISAGAPGMDTWNGTMVVSDKATSVFMDARTVGYGDAYADYYSYAVHLTASGTYLHQNPKAHTYAGRQNVTHGCVGLATDGTAKRFYDEVIPGDVVKVVGSKDTVAPGNGYGDRNVDWDDWRAGSALT
ncbi:hypothetical protein AQJ43_19965 [Streptomyces avermitilis]|uniref:L,D-TPase catalytic domain-containing protein n=1 Tax=Streptomyces avermitilis (strain ATCC 31267 / DSM 46492 / JCM 5070 / NBRC 14893 / NCIMB 12804 / NRRL 8165 / MA-4680) TaxID=227882 RepID=Q82F37_STRAW|nr:hypothetical protein AQJ43_19965 [Streptomyces avermitilis]OOV31775.1 L,D-transpeptidase [Streptomyces avermitilis]BAC72138.1 hypothetical protein SAVERM_4426 [Streptomyces avermitilis MA-4680 = NBRC 14893]GDY84355.1 hypothetical protein SAVCW2_35540 [Streptomyces avermitilis]